MLLTRVKRGGYDGATLVVVCVRPRGRAAADCCSPGRFTCYVPPALRARRPPRVPRPRNLRQPRPASAHQYHGSFTWQHPSYSPSYKQTSSLKLGIYLLTQVSSVPRQEIFMSGWYSIGLNFNKTK